MLFDPEQRYRMRYVDMIVNRTYATFRKRTQLVQSMRNFLNGRSLEVETRFCSRYTAVPPRVCFKHITIRWT